MRIDDGGDWVIDYGRVAPDSRDQRTVGDLVEWKNHRLAKNHIVATHSYYYIDSMYIILRGSLIDNTYIPKSLSTLSFLYRVGTPYTTQDYTQHWFARLGWVV